MSVIDTLNECDSHPQISVWMFAEMPVRPSEFSFSVCFLIEARPEIAKCRQLKRFQIFITSFPSCRRFEGVILLQG